MQELAWIFTPVYDYLESWKGSSPSIDLAQCDIPPTEAM